MAGPGGQAQGMPHMQGCDRPAPERSRRLRRCGAQLTAPMIGGWLARWVRAVVRCGSHVATLSRTRQSYGSTSFAPTE